MGAGERPNDTLDYDELQEHTKKVLDAAKAELARLDRQRNALNDRIHQMEIMLGMRRFPNQKRKGRIRSETLKSDIVEILSVARGKRLSAAEILDRMIETKSYPGTRSLRTRVYSSLSKWSQDGDTITRVDRGVYELI